MASEPRLLELKLYDIASEGWLIANLPCTCGGRWVRTGAQRLVDVDGSPCDELDAACNTCSTPITFRFDVSAFFGHKEKTEAWTATTLPDADERTRGRVARKLNTVKAAMARTDARELVDVTAEGVSAKACRTQVELRTILNMRFG